MGYPIQHVSFSSFRSFCTNPGEFKDKYVLGLNNFKRSPAMIVGNMAHSVIEGVIRGGKIEELIPRQLEALDSIPDSDIKFGKTGSREKIVKDFHAAIKHYFEEMPNYGKILCVEEYIESEVCDVIDGSTIRSPIPFAGKPDLVHEKDGFVTIEDHKIVTAFKDPEDENPAYIFQAFFLFYLWIAKTGKAPHQAVFREIKISANKDGSSQHNLIIVPFHGEAFEQNKVYFWYNLSNFFKMIDNTDQDSVFMENLFDMANGAANFARQKQTVFGYNRDEVKGTEFTIVEERGTKEVRFIEEAQASTIEDKIRVRLQDHGVAVKFERVDDGYAFDRYLFTPGRGTRMKDVSSKEPEICQALGLKSVRIIAPVPGTTFVGIEIPRTNRVFVKFEGDANVSGVLPVPVGMEIGGTRHVADLGDSNTPHLLAVGRTGSGKSEFLKSAVTSLVGRCDLILIDPKRTELASFKGSGTYVTTSEQALSVLHSLCREMDERYEELSKWGKTDVKQTDWKHKVVIVEEWADLVLSEDGKDIERAMLRLTFLGRAAGIHVILSTQRPDVKTVSGPLKANIGARICFATASQTDSKVALDEIGAENLLGKGDMLWRNPGHPLERLQGFHI